MRKLHDTITSTTSIKNKPEPEPFTDKTKRHTSMRNQKRGYIQVMNEPSPIPNKKPHQLLVWVVTNSIKRLEHRVVDYHPKQNKARLSTPVSQCDVVTWNKNIQPPGGICTAKPTFIKAGSFQGKILAGDRSGPILSSQDCSFRDSKNGRLITIVHARE